MNPFPSIGIVVKSGDPRVVSTVDDLIKHLCRRRAEGRLERVLLWSHQASALPVGGAQLADDEELASCQLIVAVGGDGTLLGAGRQFAKSGIPILGINRGRLGFLADIGPDQLSEAVDACLDGRASIEERLMLQATVVSRDGRRLEPIVAVNDIVLRNRTSIRMLEFETWLDGELIGRHRADGMIVATSTGSTGYALSGGGPVLHPRLEAMLLVPICPHTLSNRPIVVPTDRPLRLVPLNDPAGAALTVDGQVDRALEAGGGVEISAADHRLRLIHPPGYSYFELLRSKLGWGGAPVYREPERA